MPLPLRSLLTAVILFATASPTFAAEVQPAIKPQAQDFPLSAVKLLDSPFKQAMDADKAYLLRLDPDRLLAGFRTQAGLPKKADPYTGWEAISPTNRYTMAGHTLGHYLSALSQLAAATGGGGDPECNRRVTYIVDELAACQKAASSGILYAGPQSREMFAEIAAGNIKSDHLFRLNNGYVPFYNIHKVMAGLRDAYTLLNNQTAKEVLIRQTDWLASVFEKLTDAQVQEVLETEQGGIMEAVTNVYVLTGDSKYLTLARRLNHKKFFDPMTQRQEILTGMHANAQIPKVIGMELLYQLTGEKSYDDAARFFWDDVVTTRTFVTGGHGANEFFIAPTAFATTGINSNTGPETCNTYNMIKLSRQLWLAQPSAPIADYIERALYNHILPSQDPEHGGFVYFTPIRPGHYRVYSSDINDFWCCTGTGMENHTRYGLFIYAHGGAGDDHLWVDLLIPSELTWAQQGLTLKLDTRFPDDGAATLTLTLKEPRKFALSLRCPSWLSSGAMKCTINGAAQESDPRPGSYLTLDRTWNTGDKIHLQWPLALRTEFLPGSKEWIALLNGPVLLAGELGTAGLENFDFNNSRSWIASRAAQPVANFPTFHGSPADIIARTKSLPGKLSTFHTEGLAKPNEVTLEPFFRVHHQRYAIYWRLNPPQP